MAHGLEDVLSSLRHGNATPQVQESVLRKFVAGHRSDRQAWIQLLRLLVANESWRELSRLASDARLLFHDEAWFPFFEALGMANLLEIEKALAVTTVNGAPLNTFVPAHYLTGELLLGSRPEHAAKVFGRLLKLQPNNSRARIGMASAESLRRSEGRATVAFFLGATWHLSIQKPIFDELARQGVGCAMTTSVWLVELLRPKVVVVSDVTPHSALRRIRYALPRTRIVNTRHGLGDRNYAYHASTIVDRVCVSSEEVAQDQIADGCIDPTSVWATGFPQMDAVFRGGVQPAPATTGAPAHILFAPTFRKGLTAGDLIGEDPVSALRGQRSQWRVTVRPHPKMATSHPGLLDRWQRSVRAAGNAQIDLDFDRSPADLLRCADLLVSDLSSVALQFLALDRPIVSLVRDEMATASPYFAADSYEVQLMQAVVKVERREDLAVAVAQSLESRQPDSVVSERRRLADRLFGNLRDDQAASRIASKIRELVEAEVL